MKLKKFFVLILLVTVVACIPLDIENSSCYTVKNDTVFLQYYGGYPRAKEVTRRVNGADAKSFKFIKGSREGDCQRGHIFATDKHHVFYRNHLLPKANPSTFVALSHGYAKDNHTVFFKDEVVKMADANSFFVVKNKHRLAYGADKHGILFKTTRIDKHIDSSSFKVLPRPYFKDKNAVYYSAKLIPITGADSPSFTCPKFDSVVNFQHYAYDKNRAYYYEKGKISTIKAIDYKTFRVLNPEYAVDKNHVYYKATIIAEADVKSFEVPNKINRNVGKDKNHRYVNGIISKSN